ncbi:MAG: hypothetical protein AAF586_08260, partial [Planctomycetota bacterium]
MVDDGGDELVEEGFLDAELLVAKADGAAEDGAEDGVAAGVAAVGPVGEGEGQAAGVVGDDAIGDVDGVGELVAGAAGGVGAGTGDLLDGGEEGGEDIRVVVG